MKQKERRRAVRAPAKLAMEVKLGGVDCGQLETINVSANGVYFSSPKFIAPLTRLEITLVIPDDTNKDHEVPCEGVVVRTEPETEEQRHDRYEIACYFTAIGDRDRRSLESYILAQLPF